jgi:tripartite-type tricarboxylate transporter receptor subunit TctC
VTSVGHAISPVAYKQLPFDVNKSFSPIARLVIAPNVLVVHPSLPVKSIRELVMLAKARPGELLFGTSGVGAPNHLTLILFNSLAGTKIVDVPYKGTAPGMLDLIAGRLSVGAASITSVMPYVRRGQLRALAVVDAQRAIAEPALPTIAEAGIPGFANDNWLGVFTAADVPHQIVAKISAESVKVMQTKDVREKLLAIGVEPAPLGAEEFGAFFRQEVGKIAKIAISAGIKPE